jgi:hypothetical protein
MCRSATGYVLCHQFIVAKEDLCAAQSVIENTSWPRNPFGVKPLDEYSPMTTHMFKPTYLSYLYVFIKS